jgi:hypothetical protein
MQQRSRAAMLSERLGEFTKTKGQVMERIMDLFATLERMSLHNSQLTHVMQLIQMMKHEVQAFKAKTEASVVRMNEHFDSDKTQLLTQVSFFVCLFCTGYHHYRSFASLVVVV